MARNPAEPGAAQAGSVQAGAASAPGVAPPRGRPPQLFALFAALTGLPGLGPKTAKLFQTLGVDKPRDLAFLLPQQLIDRRPQPGLSGVIPPAVATIAAQVLQHLPAPPRGKGPARVLMRDAEGQEFTLVFFHSPADRLLRQLPPGAMRLISGRVERFDTGLQIAHPDHILPLAEAHSLPEWEPVYPLTAGLGQRAIRKALAPVLEGLPDLAEWIDPGLMRREAWPSWRQALHQAHQPQSQADIALTAPARARLAYDEMFAHQLTLALARQAARQRPGRITAGSGDLRAKVLAALPYQPTTAQSRAVMEIAADMAAPQRMNRLLQGDVGSGKTLVALLALLIAVEAGGQGVLMAPTEILARQHFDSLSDLFAAAGLRAALLTGRDRGAVRAEKLAELARGEIQILLGTHAVFQRDVVFHDLRLAVIDEQHRFGVAQRMELGAKGVQVDVLVMTATPIPRSLALTQYGDMDLSLLDEKPPGRKPVTTVLVSAGRQAEVVDHLARALAEGRQAYWVCPLVEESENSDLTAASERFVQLRAALEPALGPKSLGLVHGQMPLAEKDAAMAAFQAGQCRLLVATTVIEVGVNVPNASIMVIERAESFGLAQLHQLRGRVGRGAAQSTCLMLYQPPLGETARRRLELLRDSEDGFRLAEEDLALRGAGDVLGTAQSGLPRFRLADLERQAGLMALAQSDARALLMMDPGLSGPRGVAARTLLWLMEQDRAIRRMQVG